MMLITDLLYIIAAVIISPMVVYRMIRQNRYRHGWKNRFGSIKRSHPSRTCLWIHAVSVGEVNATRKLVKQLQDKFNNLEIVISTTTDTGRERAGKLYSSEDDITVTYFPFDFSMIIRRAFQNINPSVCILMELEVWPNFVKIAAERNVPVIVANGRLSKKSFERYRRFYFFVRHIFADLSLVLAQTEIYAERFRQIGCRENNIKVSGSLKYDTAEITEQTKGTDELREQLKLGNEPLWVAGGTGNDEERIILQVYQRLIKDPQLSDLRLAVVPRKPERFDEVAALIERMGFPLVRYSKIKRGEEVQIPENAVILGDTMGDLRKFYSLATIIFTGRSLVPMGGSDMMEAAALGKCTVFGPYTFNFEQTVEELIKGQGAMRVKDADDLYETVKECLLEPDMAQRLAENGRDVIRRNQGATEFTVEEIAKLLG